MRVFLLLLATSGVALSSPLLLLFQDQAVLMNDVSVDGTRTFSIPQGWDVMDVLGASSWYTTPEKKTYWEDIVKGKAVEIVDEVPESCELVSLSPLVLKKGSKYYLYNTTLGKWLAFVYREPEKAEKKLVVEGQGEITILLHSDGSWRAEYYLHDNLLMGNVFLSISGVKNAEVFLVSSPLEENVEKVFSISRALEASQELPPESFEAEEVKVYHLGEVENLDRSPTVEFIRVTLSKVNEYYLYELNVNEKSFDYQMTTFTKEFKAPVDLPKGFVNIFSKISGVYLIVGRTSIDDTPKDTNLKLPVTSSWDVRVKGDLLEEKKYKDFYERSWRIIVQNLNEEKAKVKIIVRGRGLKITSSSLEGYKAFSDHVVFETTVPASSEREFEFTVRSRW
ncbi:hypothetical protein [Thermotoga sp.]|uniref:hypothetical protein n=1 Tax=Thermotoga sp. TaxID=28240 RepID=UPI0025DD2B66|nr:hypothetical protein [Thermotoga sp.]